MVTLQSTILHVIFTWSLLASKLGLCKVEKNANPQAKREITFCDTLIVQELLEEDSFTLSFDFTLFRVVKETAVYIESNFQKSTAA